MTFLDIAGHFRFECSIDELLNIGDGTKALRQPHVPDAALLQNLADLPVKHEIRAPEFVDRLLGVANEKQFTRARADFHPVRFFRIIGAQQQQNLDLERIRVLKLVYKDVPEAIL
jgi:hypothetical protein